jgi:hypothetical protein
MAQQFSLGFEKEITSNSDYNCIQCSEPVTNPICHDCLGRGVEQWLNLYPNIKKAIKPKLKKYIREVNNSAVTMLGCVSCGKKKAALCPYCFSEGIFSLLKGNKVDRAVLGDFLSIFNFDLHREGYIADAIREGLY